MATKAKKRNSKTKPKAAAKRDKFGLKVGSKVGKAAAMFENGSTMADVRSETGGNQYNVLKWLERQGHAVRRKDGVYTVTPKAPQQ